MPSLQTQKVMELSKLPFLKRRLDASIRLDMIFDFKLRKTNYLLTVNYRGGVEWFRIVRNRELYLRDDFRILKLAPIKVIIDLIFYFVGTVDYQIISFEEVLNSSPKKIQEDLIYYMDLFV